VFKKIGVLSRYIANSYIDTTEFKLAIMLITG